MPDLYNLQTKEWEPVKEEDVQGRLEARTHVFAPGTQVQVVLKGKYGTVPAEQLDALIADGGFYDSAVDRQRRLDEAKYGGRPGTAALHGLGRGLSFGLSDYLLRAAYSEEELKKIEEHNELAAKGAEFASYLIPSKAIAKAALSLGKLGMPGRAVGGALKAVSAPSRAAAAAGRKTTQTVMGKLPEASGMIGASAKAAVGLGAGAGVEGLMYASITDLSEHALGKPDTTAEEIASSTGYSALFGAALGGAPGMARGLGELYSATVGKIPAAGGRILDDVTASLHGFDRQVVREAKDNPEKLWFAIDKQTREQAENALVGETRVAIDKLVDAFDDVAEKARGTSKKAAMAKAVEGNGEVAFRRAEELLFNIQMQADSILEEGVAGVFHTPGIREVRQAAESTLQRLTDKRAKMLGRKNAVPEDELRKFTSEVFNEVDDFKKVMSGRYGKYFKKDFETTWTKKDSNSFDHTRDVYSETRAFLEDASVFGEKAAAMQREVNEPFSRIIAAKKDFNSYFLRKNVAGRYVANPDKARTYLRKLDAELQEPDIALRSQVFDDFVESFEQFARSVDTHYGSTPAAKKALANLQGLRQNQLDHFDKVRFYNTLRPMLTPSLTPGITSMVMGSARAVGSKVGAAPLAMAAGQIVNPGVALRHYGGMMQNKARARDRMNAFAKDVVESMRVSGVDDLKSAAQYNTGKYGKRVDGARRLLALAGNDAAVDEKAKERDVTIAAIEAIHQLHTPERLASVIDKGTKQFNETPELQAAVAKQSSKLITYLSNAIQGVQFRTDPLSGETEVLASDAQLAKIGRIVSASFNPFQDLAQGFIKGDLTKDTVDTVMALYPEMYNDFILQVHQGTIELKDKKPHEKKIQLSMMTGAAMTPYADKKFLAVMQAVHGHQPTGSQQPRGYSGALNKIPKRELLPLQSAYEA